MLRDQAVKRDAGKARLSLVPTEILFAVAAVREWAVETKYPDKDGWKAVEPERYVDAIGRHWARFNEDPFALDEESGLPVLWHLATNAAFLIWLHAHGDAASMVASSAGRSGTRHSRFDRMKAASIEDTARFFLRHDLVTCDWCRSDCVFSDAEEAGQVPTDDDCLACILRWLREEADDA